MPTPHRPHHTAGRPQNGHNHRPPVTAAIPRLTRGGTDPLNQDRTVSCPSRVAVWTAITELPRDIILIHMYLGFFWQARPRPAYNKATSFTWQPNDENGMNHSWIHNMQNLHMKRHNPYFFLFSFSFRFLMCFLTLTFRFSAFCSFTAFFRSWNKNVVF